MLATFRTARFSRLCASALALFALGSSSVFAAPTVRFKLLHEFHETDGVASVGGPLVKGIDGRLYGVLPLGGEYGQGVLFSLTPQGDFRLLYSFSGGLDGGQPTLLFRDPDGHVYGATPLGGLEPGYGVLFSVGADGTPTVVHNFMGDDGGQIGGGLVQFKKGSFYGTTGIGGSGTVFRFTPPSTVETLHEFGLAGDPANPYFGLSKAGGVFYGTTYEDPFSSTPTYGTVYRVTDSGELTTLYSFTGGADGSRPVGPPVRAADGNLYGIASEGGEFGCGTIYRIDATGAFTLVHTFTGDVDGPDGDGCYPFAALLKGKDGRLYSGTTSGVIFRVSVSGVFEVLHKFENANEGGSVMFPLIEGHAGTFFGMTLGGLADTGTVFKLVVRDIE